MTYILKRKWMYDSWVYEQKPKIKRKLNRTICRWFNVTTCVYFCSAAAKQTSSYKFISYKSNISRNMWGNVKMVPGALLTHKYHHETTWRRSPAGKHAAAWAGTGSASSQSLSSS